MAFRKYATKSPKGSGKAVFVDGVRSPFVKSFGVFDECDSLELFSRVTSGLLRRQNFDVNELDQIIAGAVVPQTKNPNVARDAIINLNLPPHIHGYTLNRACTTSLQTAIDAVNTIRIGKPELILAGGVETLSDVPIVYSKSARKFMLQLSKAKTTAGKLNLLTKFSVNAWMPKPPSLSEPLTGLTMGQHAEIMAKKNNISRESQDQFAYDSHMKAAAARKEGRFKDEIVPIWAPPKYSKMIGEDDLVREDTSIEKLQTLRPVFDKKYGTISAGNSSPITDGASVCLIGDEQRVKDLGLTPKTRIVDYAFVGLDPNDQLLIGPAVAIPLLLQRNNLKKSDIDLFEIHEAFAAQVLSCLRSMESDDFCKDHLGMSKAFGEIDPEKLNVNGGAIALGHPFGATGVRLISTLSNELIRSDKRLGVVAVCAAGGIACAMLVERV